jgi:6-phosphogluconolactonase
MKTKPHATILFAAFIFSFFLAEYALGAEPASPQGEYIVYIGTYTGKESKGIYAYRFDSATGRVSSPGLAAETENPSWLTVHPNQRFLYAANETGNYQGAKSGAVSAFAIDRKTGKLTFLNQVASRGADPCHATVDKTGKNLLVANYSSGNIAVFRLHEDGRLGEASAFVQHTGSSVNRDRQEGPHAHSIAPSPDNRFVLNADLGLDELLVYRFDPEKGSLTANDPPFAKLHPGAGPRHFAFHPNGKFVYVISEMQSTVTAFAYDAARGSLRELQTVSTLPKDFAGESTTAEIRVDDSGRFLYGSNRGHDSIAVFSIDAVKGTLTPVEIVSTGGKEPRNFEIDPTGKYLFAANQNSGSVVVFRIDAKSGRLTPTGEEFKVPSPVCVTFVGAE